MLKKYYVKYYVTLHITLHFTLHITYYCYVTYFSLHILALVKIRAYGSKALQ